MSSNVAAKNWVIVLYCMAILGVIGAFVAFMMMMETSGEVDKYRASGRVSMALVLDMERDVDTVVTKGIGRRSSDIESEIEYNFVRVRFVANSPIAYADWATGVLKEGDLPAAPPATGNPLEDSKFEGTMDVDPESFAEIKPGELLPVVTVPWDSTSPRPLSEIRDYSSAPYYPWMFIGILAGLGFWFAARKVGKRARQGQI